MKERIDWVDTAKGWGIFFIILTHIDFKTFSGWLYSFHVPLFFFISGFLFSPKENFKIFFLNKFKKMIIPYFSMMFIVVFFQTFVMHLDSFFQLILNGVLQIRYGTLWFLSTLIVTEFVFYFVEKISNYNLKWGIIFYLFILGLVYNIYVRKFLIWNLDVVPVALFYFSLGNLCHKKEIILGKFNSFYWMPIFLLLDVSFNFLTVAISGEHLDMNFSLYGVVPFTILASLFGILWVVVTSRRKIKLISYFGKNSLVYFALHQQVLMPIYERTIQKLSGVEYSLARYGIVLFLLYKIGEIIFIFFNRNSSRGIFLKNKTLFYDWR